MHPDEPTLYTAMRNASAPTDGWLGTTDVLAIAARLGVRTVRLDALMAEWTRAGWWEDGSGTFSGFFTDRAPRTIDEIEQVAA
jgi:hypothetical protein